MSRLQNGSTVYENPSWVWFCGDKWEYELFGNSTAKSLDPALDNCVVNIIDSVWQLVYILIFFTTLLIKRLIWKPDKNPPFLLIWPGHFIRWALELLLLVLCIASVAEGIVSHLVRQNGQDTTPQLYLPASFLFIATATSLMFYQLAEIWRTPWMCLILMGYWITCLATGGVRIAVFYQEAVPLDTTALWITILMTVIHIVLVLLEFNLIRLNIYSNRLQSRGYHKVGSPSSNADVTDDMRYTEDHVSFLYYITFWWMNWLLKLGYRRPVTLKDLGTLSQGHRSQFLYKTFKEDFDREMKAKIGSGGKPSLWRIYGRVFKRDIICAGLARLVYDTASFVGPLSLSGVINYVIRYTDNVEVQPHQYVSISEFFSNGFVLIGLIFFANVLQYVMWQQNLYKSNVVGVHVRTAIQTMVYDKALRLSCSAMSGGSLTAGQITNHMSSDAMNMFFFSQRMHYLWAVPFRVIAVVILLYYQVGSPMFFCLAALLIAVSIQLLTARLQTVTQKSIMKSADERLRRSNEMLLGIKLLKLYGWEEMVCAAIERIRKSEMAAILKYTGCYGINFCIVMLTPTIMNLAVFVSFPYITGQPLTPASSFAALSLMNLLMEPMYFVPMVTSLLVNAFVGVSRLEHFFMASETERDDGSVTPDMSSYHAAKEAMPLRESAVHSHYGLSPESGETCPLLADVAKPFPYVLSDTDSIDTQIRQEMTSTPDTNGKSSSYAIKIINGNFTWNEDCSAPLLQDINLMTNHGDLVMIVGPVGSGKSSLLSAILGEMQTLSGSVRFGSQKKLKCTPGVAYCAQTAWLKNATLRDNILFGQSYNRLRYRKVIEASALKPDIDILPGGDMTEIGEKGINLSGGQKQRVSVARAMYSKNDIILLDDPLSALDVNVGSHLFHRGILGRMKKSNRTVVLVTHQLQYLQSADKIILMKNGRITRQGTFDDIVGQDPDLQKMWEQDIIAATETEGSSTEVSDSESERDALKKQVCRIKRTQQAKDFCKGKIIQQEELARGSVSTRAYFYYIQSMGLLWAFAFTFSRMALEAFNVSRNFWLSNWSEAGLANNATISDVNSVYLPGYLGLALCCLLMAVCNGYAAVMASWNAAKRVYIRMLRNISRSPMRFFDTTPVGRILNRFSSDTQIIDTKLLVTTTSQLHFFSSFVFAVVVNIIITPIFILEVLPIIIIYYILGAYFIRSSRELQRLDSVTRSPVFAHFSETLCGLTTIRAYRVQTRFFDDLLRLIDTNNTPFLYLQAAYGWLGVQMSMCGGLMLLMVGCTTLLEATVVGNLDASRVGLALSYVFLISQQLFNLIRFSADTEMQMNPVERVQYYAKLPTENYEGSQPPPKWPSKGKIEISNISVRYAETLPPVLHEVSLSVQPGEKVGICGRTGSGKSSLTLALFRLIQTCKGKINVDGVNIAHIPITTLRQRLSIIPQDPVLFTGTIRSNLDPHENKSDNELWQALEIAQLKSLVIESPCGLDTLVSEGGENFSVGQRQLFCLARAFLKNSRVLIMDEATASIDYDTEKVLQEVVNSVFQEKTVLTIAHRVSTILESDTIWVLDKGKIIECDTPANLLAQPMSIFYSMVQANK